MVSRNAYGSPTVISDSLGNRAYSYYSPHGRKYFTHSDAGGWQKPGSVAPASPSGTAYVAEQRMPMAVKASSAMTTSGGPYANSAPA